MPSSPKSTESRGARAYHKLNCDGSLHTDEFSDGTGKSKGGSPSMIRPLLLAQGAAERDRRLFQLAAEVERVGPGE